VLDGGLVGMLTDFSDLLVVVGDVGSDAIGV
jgi:hypothetical protein